MARDISPERKVMYYLGMALMVVGLLLFLSTFFSIISGTRDTPRPTARFEHLPGLEGMDVDVRGTFDSIQDMRQRSAAQTTRAFAGMILLGVGAFIRKVAARGLAGSGVILSPEDARDDLEPYSRMAGGILKDALGEADVRVGGAAAREIIRVKCRACGGLNDEDAKFCKACGKAL